MNWMQYMANPQTFAIKKYMSEILKEKYPPHEAIIERLIPVLSSTKDYEAFGRLIADLYETAYLKAVGDHKEALAKVGLKANVVAEKPK
jgi:hypothetical protein